MSNSRQDVINEIIKTDAFAAKLGAEILEVKPGYSRVRLAVEAEHHNFHGMTHGGAVFSLADIAFAAASNSRGQTAVALDMSISFMQASAAGAILVAEAHEVQLNGPIGLYEITVKSASDDTLVAKLQATVYRKKSWFVAEEEG